MISRLSVSFLGEILFSFFPSTHYTKLEVPRVYIFSEEKIAPLLFDNNLVNQGFFFKKTFFTFLKYCKKKKKK